MPIAHVDHGSVELGIKPKLTFHPVTRRVLQLIALVCLLAAIGLLILGWPRAAVYVAVSPIGGWLALKAALMALYLHLT